MGERGRQSKSRRARVDRRDPFEVWKERVRAEQDPDRKDAIIEAGVEAGFCDKRGRIIDPDASSHEALNDEIRIAAGRRPRFEV
jgi:hypothetical protein